MKTHNVNVEKMSFTELGRALGRLLLGEANLDDANLFRAIADSIDGRKIILKRRKVEGCDCSLCSEGGEHD